MRTLGAALLVLAFVASGCTAVVPASPAPSLRGTSWVVTRIAGEPTLADYQPTMAFGPGGELTGDNGCNLYSGSYRLSGAGLTFTPPAQTMMACTDGGRAEQETAFAAALAAVASVRGANTHLELLDAAGTVVLELGPVPPLELAGTSWLLAGVVDGSSLTAPVDGTAVTLSFDAGSLSGKACNSFRGGYQLSGSDIAVGTLASTRMMCTDPGVMEQEALVLELLEAATRAQQSRGVLVLTAPDGRGLQFGKA